jgi:hypothetical protein
MPNRIAQLATDTSSLSRNDPRSCPNPAGGASKALSWEKVREIMAEQLSPSVNLQSFGAGSNVFKISENGLDRRGALDLSRL